MLRLRLRLDQLPQQPHPGNNSLRIDLTALEGHDIRVGRGALVDDENRVLLVQRRFDGGNGGMWEIPGGQIEPGEDEAQAVMREFREETGLDIVPASPFFTAEKRQLRDTPRSGLYIVRCAVAQHVGGELHINSSEVNDARWIDYQQALRLPDITQASRNGLDILGRHALQHTFA